MIKRDLEFGDFIEIYESEIYCAYMETGCYYDMELEDFEEWEFEAYKAQHGQWASDPAMTRESLSRKFNITEGENIS